MEISHFASKLKALKLELSDDLLVHLVLISLPPQFSQFKGKKRKNEATKDKGPAHKKQTQANNDDACFFCNMKGHMKKECAKYIAWRAKKGTFLTLVYSEVNLASVPRNTWWLDFGATTNISVSMQGCLSYRKPNDDERSIYVGDGKLVNVEAVSLSINSNTVGTGSLMVYDKLYLFDTVASYNETLNVESRGTKRKMDNEKSSSLWHKRLGHISKNRVERLVSDGILDSIDFSDFDVCIECIKGKQTKTKKLGVKRAIDVLELIHTDICGPFPTPSWNGQQYFVSSIDDYSRYAYLFLLHEKSQVLDVLKSFKAEVENQLSKRIKQIRSDRGGEYYGRYDGSAEARPYRPNEKKLEPKTVSSYFIGYSERSRDFKFYDPKVKNIFETRTAKFFEDTEFGGEIRLKTLFLRRI
ncbi:uncharacterized protein LOC133034525 [Cannabis sativa]|uniref:uncharacterized protein LOC133034525 n=1 Tax=Cannabis sativa TaxID=3483 RepID=UPI0029CAA1DD|nr:uncharacterized protein LOC133034525 [Cannabis sativa]